MQGAPDAVVLQLDPIIWIDMCGVNGLFTLTERDSGTDSDLDSKPEGEIALLEYVHIPQT